MRARMAIAVSGVEVELREIVLRDKPAEMLEVSPKGTVPVLLMPSGCVIDESFLIMQWALNHADPQEWFVPHLENSDAVDALIAACDGEFKFHLDRYKYASRYEGAVASDHRAEACRFLRQLEQQFAENSFLFGDRSSLADFAIMPFVRQFANVDRNWFDETPFEKLRAWLEGMLVSGVFVGVMKKYPRWQVGQAPVLFPG